MLFRSTSGQAYRPRALRTTLGRCVPMVASPLYQRYDLSHAPKVCARDQDGGKNDGFDLAPTGARKPNKWQYEPYQYTQRSDVETYWAFQPFAHAPYDRSDAVAA